MLPPKRRHSPPATFRSFAAINSGVALLAVAWFAYDLYLLPAEEGADIGFGLFMLLTVPAALGLSVFTTVVLVRHRAAAAWTVVSLVSTLVLAGMLAFVPCWSC